MDKFKKTLLNIDNDKFTLEQLVSILVLIVSKININSISGMARSENKTPRGILISNQYRKILIGVQKLCVKGLPEDKFPF